MLVGISSLRARLQDGTELCERQTEAGKEQGPQCPALCHLPSPGESRVWGSRTLACGENSRRSCQSTGLHTAVSGVTWLETSPGLTPLPRALGSDQDGMFASW